MKLEVFYKWMNVLEKAEKKNKELLKNGEITKNAYILLNTINLNKYREIIKQYHQQLA